MTSKERAKDYRLRKRYGITLKQYYKMLKAQNYKCVICGKEHETCKYGLCVDHNHKTGRVRGLLCMYCNRKVVGRIGDDKKRMRGLIKYISKQLVEDTKWK